MIASPRVIVPEAHFLSDAVAPGAVVLEGVSKRFGSHTVVEDVSLEVAGGEVVAVIGPSGAGKSTLLRCINLLEAPSEGRIVVGGVEVSSHDGKLAKGADLANLRRRVGLVVPRLRRIVGLGSCLTLLV